MPQRSIIPDLEFHPRDLRWPGFGGEVSSGSGSIRLENMATILLSLVIGSL